MNRRANPILTLSLCTAIAVHLLGMSAAAWWYISTHEDVQLPPIDRWKAIADVPAMAKKHDAPRIVLPKPAVSPAPVKPKVDPPAPPPLPPPPPPPPKPVLKEQPHELPKPDPSPRIKDDSGEEKTHGTANRSTPGEDPMQALTGLNQADLMQALKDDKLLIDPKALNPASAGEKNGSSDPRATPSSAGVQQPVFVAEGDPKPTPDSDPNKPMGAPPVKPGSGSGPIPQRLAATENHPAATGSTHPTPNAKPAVTTDNKEPPRAVKGRLATASDTDSAAMKEDGTFEFKAGKMVAREGLNVKWSQPRFGDASYVDLRGMTDRDVVFVVQVDVTGKVTDVGPPSPSSGSQFVDQDIKDALWDCKFAPEKDNAGHPKPTIWTIHFLI